MIKILSSLLTFFSIAGVLPSQMEYNDFQSLAIGKSVDKEEVTDKPFFFENHQPYVILNAIFQNPITLKSESFLINTSKNQTYSSKYQQVKTSFFATILSTGFPPAFLQKETIASKNIFPLTVSCGCSQPSIRAPNRG